MLTFILTRLLTAIPTLFAVTVFAFLLTAAARGDPALLRLQQTDQEPTPELIALVRAELGLDEPLPVRYGRWLGGLLRGDLGTSFLSQRPVSSLLADRIAPTLLLGSCAFLVSLVVGVGAGLLLATSRQPWLDVGVRTLVSVLNGVPSFWLAIGLIMLVGVQWQLLPVAGYGTWQHLVLPTAALAFGSITSTMRLTRNSVLDVLHEDYVRTARAKGLPAHLITRRHILRNVALPITALTGVRFGYILSGAAIVESIFAWPGMGSVLISAVAGRDLPVIGGYLLVVSIPIILANILADIVTRLFDPRVEFRATGERRAG